MLNLIILCMLPVLCEGKGVVLIIGADTGLQLGPYKARDIHTPHLDQLAANGVVFQHAFTSSVTGGSPSRSTILSGLPAHQNGMFGLSVGHSKFSSHSEVMGVSNILSAAGVKTGIIGIHGLDPVSSYKFDYSQTDATNDPINIGRNITLINSKVEEFLGLYKSGKFFLVISLGDSERCGDSNFGQFCEDFGNGSSGMGTIPDWKPTKYTAANITSPPYFIPRAEPSKVDLASMYSSVDRLDQGVGLYIETMNQSGVLNDSLVIYTSTGGMSFPGAKYNAYNGGMATPLIMSSSTASRGKTTEAVVSSLDLTPTILDYFGVVFPKNYSILGRPVTPTGQSLLPILNDTSLTGHSSVFTTQNFGQVEDDFSIRSVRNGSYKLISNLKRNFHISADIYQSPTFQFIQASAHEGTSTGWWRTLTDYLNREPLELFDYSYDPLEVDNVAYEPKYQQVMTDLLGILTAWQNATQDPWLCLRGYVLVDGYCRSYL